MLLVVLIISTVSFIESQDLVSLLSASLHYRKSRMGFDTICTDREEEIPRENLLQRHWPVGVSIREQS